MEFATEQLAETNFAKLKDAKLRGKQLIVDYVGDKSTYVKKAVEKKAQEAAKREPDLKRLHLGGFDRATKEEQLKKLLTSAGGSLLEFVMPMKKDKHNPEKSINMGFAFATFATEADAKKALEASNGKKINDRALKVDYAFQRTEATAPASKKSDEPAAKKVKTEPTAAVTKQQAAPVAEAKKGNEVAAKKDGKKEAPVAVKKEATPAAAKKQPDLKKDQKAAPKKKVEEDEDDEDDEEDDDDDDDGNYN